MAARTDAIGKTYPADLYAVGREKIREYASAVGETDPLHTDLAAARAAGHADLVAPPMFVVVFMGRAVAQVLFDPEAGIDFARLVHGAQEFDWHELIVAGDEITTVATLADIRERPGGLTFYEIRTESRNQHGVLVVTGLMTNIVRGDE